MKHHTLKNRIRGWFPGTPVMPNPQATPQMQPSRIKPTPLPPQLEGKYQRDVGLGVGLGLGPVLLGGFGTLMSMQTYRDVARYVGYEGAAADDWLFRDLTSQLSIYLMLLTAGAVCVVFCLLFMRSTRARELTLNPNRLSNAMVGGGGAMGFYSLRMLFMYLLTGDVIQLQLFMPAFTIGVVVAGAGLFWGWRRKPWP